MPLQITSKRLHVVAAEKLRQEIEAGRWEEWLPDERALSASLNISRPTLSRALGILENERRLTRFPRRGWQIKQNGTPDQGGIATTPTIGILLNSAAQLTFMLFEIVKELQKLGMLVLVFNQDTLTHTNKGTRNYLETLIKKYDNEINCWLLLHVNSQVKKWMKELRANCLSYDKNRDDCQMPGVYENQLLVTTHALNLLANRGHRNVMIINSVNDDDRTVIENFQAQKTAERRKTTIHLYDLALEQNSLDKGVDRLIRLNPRPTGVIINNFWSYLTLSGNLNRHGIRIPEDVSVVCLASGVYSKFLYQKVTEYRIDIKRCVSKIKDQIMLILKGDRTPNVVEILPELHPGETVASPPEFDTVNST